MSPGEYETIVSEIVADIRRDAPELSGMTLGFGLKNKLQAHPAISIKSMFHWKVSRTPT